MDGPKTLGIHQKILYRMRMLAWKIHDHILSGINIRHGSVTLLKRAFDQEYYLEHNPDVADRSEPPLEHFLTNGIYEQRKARFFDSHWYTRAHNDIFLSPIDAFTHFKLYGKDEGRSARYFQIRSVLERASPPTYEEWCASYDPPDKKMHQSLKHQIEQSAPPKRVMILLEITDAFSRAQVEAFLDSVDQQIAGLFDVIALIPRDDTQWDERIAKSGVTKVVYDAQNPLSDIVPEIVETCAHEFITWVKTPIQLHPLAGFWLNQTLAHKPEFDLAYFDDDEINDKGVRKNPRFKSQSNPEFLLACAFAAPFIIFRSSALKSLGGFRFKYGEYADIDAALRLMEMRPDAIVHLPYVGIHKQLPWALNPTTYKKVVADHLKPKGIKATITKAPETPNGLRICYAVPAHSPLVSIIIPTRDRLDILKTCITSVIEKTTYPNYEIIIVDNGSVEPQTLQYLSDIRSDTIHILRDDRPFNYSALNNAAAKMAKGEYLCLMNNDIEVITPDWIEEMLGFAARADTGCVGARLWYPDQTLQHGGVLVGFHNAAGHLHKFLPKGEPGYMGRAVLQQNVGAVTAACLMVAKDIYWQVGGLDEDFVVAFNDVDFCLKVEALGLRNVWTPYAEMIHYESASRGANVTPEKLARENREVSLLRTKWGDRLKHEPSYSPNLTFTAEDLSLAFPPRTETIVDYWNKTPARSKSRKPFQKH